jgi:hypothetical protein
MSSTLSKRISPLHGADGQSWNNSNQHPALSKRIFQLHGADVHRWREREWRTAHVAFAATAHGTFEAGA